jgi:hypothetical protein
LYLRITLRFDKMRNLKFQTQNRLQATRLLRLLKTLLMKINLIFTNRKKISMFKYKTTVKKVILYQIAQDPLHNLNKKVLIIYSAKSLSKILGSKFFLKMSLSAQKVRIFQIARLIRDRKILQNESARIYHIKLKSTCKLCRDKIK